MSRDYNISRDGTIFEIKEDGSISKIARITENGTIEGVCSQSSSSSSSSGKGWLWFFLICFAIATFVLGISNSNLHDDYYQQYNRAQEYEEKYENQCNIVAKASAKMPIIISSIDIGNVTHDGDIINDYGKIIYSYQTSYLKPKISYFGLKKATIAIKVKWYTSDGYIRRGDSSPDGFSFSKTLQISEGYNSVCLTGWGNKYSGNWSSGKHRIEIWYEDVCLASSEVFIY